MTLSYDCVTQNFYAAGLAVGESVVVTGVPSSSNPSGVATLEIVRLTDEYCKVREVS